MSTAFKLRNGTILLSTEAPGGIYNAAQLKKIASICEGEAAIVKATEDQRLALCVKPDQANAIANELKSIGLGIRHYQDGLHHPTSCIGELCPDHEQDALGSALDVSQQLENVKLTSPLKIGINGCARCCVPCHTLDISVIGDASGYRMHLGGKNSQLPEMASFMAEGIPASELPKLILEVIALYKKYAQEGESLQEVIERAGSTDFINLLSPYSQDAAGNADPFGGSEPTADAAIDDSNIEEEGSLNLEESLPEMDLAVSDEVEDLNLEAAEIPEANLDEIDLSPNLIADDGSSFAVTEDELESASEQNDQMPPVQEDQLPFSDQNDIAFDAVGADLSPMSDDFTSSVDINPNGNDNIGDLENEVTISSQSFSSGPDIALSDDFGEDNIDTIPGVDNDALVAAAAEDLQAMPDDDLQLIDHQSEDISEAQIDVSDVMKAPVVETIPTSVTESKTPSELELAPEPELMTDALSETNPETIDEDVYEKQLTDSIAQQEQFVDQSDSDQERQDALDILSDTETTIDDGEEFIGGEVSSLGQEDSLDEGSFQNDQISLSEPAAALEHPEELPEELDNEFEDTVATDPHDHLPLSEVVGTMSTKASVELPTPMRQPTKLEPVSTHKKATSGWTFAGLDVDSECNPVISFSNGVQITLTEDAVANGSITVGGHHIILASVNGGIEMQMDGMKMFLPKAA